MTVTMTTADCTLDVGGMTCASCVGRVERALHKIDGVNDAQVNLATEVATVSFDPTRVDTDDLVRAITRAGYTATPKHRTSEDAAEVAPALPTEPDDDRELRRLKRRWQITLAAGLGLMVLMYVPFYIDTMDILMPAVLAVSTVALAWAGRDVYRSAWTAARHGSVGMNTLVALSTAVAYGYSAFVTLWPSLAEQWGLPLHVYFETALVILALVLAGRWMEARAKKSTAAAITALMDLAPPTARVLRDGTERELPIEQVVVGDLVRIRPGDTVPVDAEITEGSSTVDESLITGESRPVDKVLGDSLLAGTANRTGSVLARVSAVGADTALAQITRLVQEAQAGKVPMQRLADRISAWFIPIVLVLAALTFTGWLLFGPDTGRLTMAVSTSIAVLIIACPCALGLATPTAVMVGTGRAAELGILIGNGDALQRAAGLTAVVLDKTGTITTGRPRLTGVHPATGWTRDEVLALAAAAEVGSEHPVGQAIVAAAHSLTRPAVQSFEALPGYGITAAVDGRSVLAGNAALMAAHGVDTGGLTAVEDGTPVFLAVDGIGVAVLTVADTVKSESAEAIAALRALGLQVWMLTGDTAATAASVADQVGIRTDRVLADVRPAEKAAAIGCLQDDGQIVAMVGDGINDAAALSTADVGIAIGTGADVAIAASDVTLVGGDLRGIVSAIALSRRTVATMKQGLGWAFAYNVLLIPVAAGALYLVGGPLLDPILASAAMAMSSVSVLTNALRLRRFERPASAEQILHPPLRQRVGQWSYLATVATVALLIGGTLNAVSRMDFAARGMNGTLAWTQGTGMPMRPAMSVMMTADVPPDEAADAGVDLRLVLPPEARAGVPTRLTITVTDTETGRPVTDLVRSHEAWMHLIATRADLGTFAHVHPAPTGRPGELAVDLVFPTAGDYIVNTEFRRQGRLADVHERIVLTVAGDAPAPDRPVIGPRSVIVDGVRVELTGEARAEGRSDLHFTFTDEATGRPIDDLQPYLAAAGHVVIMRADGGTFTHEHAETRDEQGRPEFAVPGTTFGPDLGLHTELDGPGRYRIWGQFRMSDDRLITAPFTVDAS